MQRECLGHNPTVVPHPLTDVTITLTPSAPGVAGVCAGCLMCKPHKDQRRKDTNDAQPMPERRARVAEVEQRREV